MIEKQMERAVLGTILVYTEYAAELLSLLKQDYFGDKLHRDLFSEIVNVFNDNKPIDPVLVVDRLKNYDTNFLMQYVLEISLEAVPFEVAVQLIEELREKAIARELLSLSHELQLKIKSNVNSQTLLQEIEDRLSQITQEKNLSLYSTLKDVINNKVLRLINELAKRQSVITGIPSGFSDLDRLTLGFQNSDFIVIAGRPGMGKTSFALSIVSHVAIDNNIPVGFFSLEMSEEQLGFKILSERTDINLKDLRTGSLTDEQIEKIINTTLQINNAPLFIDDTAGLTLFDLKAKARRLKKEKDIKIIVVDYLQLLRSHRRVENRQQEVAEISRGLKGLAKELGIPVVALAQLSRQTEMRADKRPQLSDLRESGSIEQDADLVLFIHRPEYYKKDQNNEAIAEVIVAKQRNGPTGIVNLFFLKDKTAFKNIDRSSTDFQDDDAVPF
jgi:replicative DNA helicase